MDENKPPEEPMSDPEPMATPGPEPTPPPATPDPVPPPSSTPPPSVDPMAAMNTGGKGPVPYSGAPDPSVPQDERTQALLMWILSLFIGFISPLIFYFIAKDKPFVFHHSAQALTLHIVFAVLWVVAIILSFLCIGFLMMPIIGILALVMTIMGAIAANAGSRFEPPVTGNLSKSWFKA